MTQIVIVDLLTGHMCSSSGLLLHTVYKCQIPVKFAGRERELISRWILMGNHSIKNNERFLSYASHVQPLTI